MFHFRYWLRDIDMNVCDYDGRTALHLASAEGKKYLKEEYQIDTLYYEKQNNQTQLAKTFFNQINLNSKFTFF